MEILYFKEFFGDDDIRLDEEIASYHEIPDKDGLYQAYHDAYAAAGLKPWSKDDFEWRAEKWMFAGVLPKPGMDPQRVGLISARETNGTIKLTGTLGANAKGKVGGMIEISKLGQPVWGAMDKDFTVRLQKLGFTSPPATVMKLFFPVIQSDPMFHSGGTWDSINPDGSVSFNLSGVGQTTKFFTGNKEFFRILISKVLAKAGPGLGSSIKMWSKVPPMMRPAALSSIKTKLPPNLKDLDVESLDWIANVMEEQPAVPAGSF